MFCAPLHVRCMLKRTASCNLSSFAGYFCKALTKTRQYVWNNGSLTSTLLITVPPTKWTLCMLPVVFPHFLCYKKATSVVSTVRTGTRKPCENENSLNFSLLLWVCNGAAPVVNSHRGVYSSIVLSFSDCRKSKRPVLKPFRIPFLLHCVVQKCWMF